MTTPQFAIAKYIPDLSRFEPRNIGVVVWSPDGVEARFVAERRDQPGVIGGRSIPSFVTSPTALRQWIEFWRNEMQKSDIESADGRRFHQTSPEFLSALQSWNRGNFQLVEAGYLLEAFDGSDLSELADQLYEGLVDTSGIDEPRDPTLDEICDRLIAETNLSNDPHFSYRHRVSCPIDSSTVETFEFSHAYANGTIERLYQRVPLPRRKKLLRKSVHDCAWMFEKVVAAEVISREKTAALVHTTGDMESDEAIQQALSVLATVSRVLDLRDYDAVKREFANLSVSISVG